MIYGTFGIHPHETSNELITKDFIVEWCKKNNLSWTIEHDIFILKKNNING